jgi:hypothetical protein
MSAGADESASALPEDLRELVEELLAVEQDAEALVDALDDEQFNWSPAPRTWSIAQCLEHLNVTNTRYFTALADAVERARQAGYTRRGPIDSTWVGRRFVALLEPPVRSRLRAPGAIRPVPRRHKAEVWPEFVRQHTHMRSCVAGWRTVDLNRAVFKNPLGPFGSLRAGTGLKIIAAHDRRHVWQASRVRGAAGFPRS